MTEGTPIGVLEKIKACINSLKAKREIKTEADTGVQGSKTHADPEDIEFLERELGIYPKSRTEGRATRGPHGSS